MTGWMPPGQLDLEAIANDGGEELVDATCEFDVSPFPPCAEEVVGLLKIEALTGHPQAPETSLQFAALCGRHWEQLLRLDAARPVFWQVTQAVLLLRAPAVEVVRT